MSKTQKPEKRDEEDIELEDKAFLELNWLRDDIERRLGFQGGRYTHPGHGLTILLAIGFTITFFALLIFLVRYYPPAESFTDTFLDRGIVPYAIVFFFFWGWSILLIKKKKLNYQQRALELAAMPQKPDFVLNLKNARVVHNRIHSLVDSPSHFVLLNRIERALSNLSNVGQISDVSTILSTQAKDDEESFAASYNVIRGFVWAIPVLGFIGTVLGLGIALGSFGEALQASGDVDSLKTSLRSVTGGLSTAFDTTLLGLIAALFLQLQTTFLQQKEFLFLDDCNDYCHVNVVSKLKLTELES